MGKLVRVRRRPRYPLVSMGGSLGEVGGPSPEDLMWGIVREACGACHGGILHLLSLELDDDRCGEFIVGEGSRSLCLYLGGRDSGFRVEIGPGASRVCFMGGGYGSWVTAATTRLRVRACTVTSSASRTSVRPSF